MRPRRCSHSCGAIALLVAAQTSTAAFCSELWGNGEVDTNPPGPCIPFPNKSSLVQTGLGLTLNGYGAQVSGGNRLADDFVVPPGSHWRIDHVSIMAYQVGAAPGQSTIDFASLRIWQGAPGEGGVLLWESPANVLCTSWFSGIYRHSDANCTLTRPLYENMLSLDSAPVLPPGEYWIDLQLGGQLPSGPWVPPVTYDGLTGAPNANARQYQAALAQWVPLTDPGYPNAGAPQELPFRLFGDDLGQPKPGCKGDIDGDGLTGQGDLGILLAAYSACAGSPGFIAAADLDGDGCIGQGDLGILLAHYGCSLDQIIGIGIAWDGQDSAGPATITHLWNTSNVCWLAPGDVILEYRGMPISNGMELSALVESLPEVNPGEPVPMLVMKGGWGVPTLIEPVAFAYSMLANSQDDFKTVFTDRRCDIVGEGCECETADPGKTCVRILHVEYNSGGKIVKTWASCADGTTVCPKPPEKKGDGK